jgi:hypothetical protein
VGPDRQVDVIGMYPLCGLGRADSQTWQLSHLHNGL